MKKKFLIVVVTICLVISSLMFHASAVTIYEMDGYSFTYTENNTASICGWDNRSENFTVPNMLAGVFVTEISRNGLQSNKQITSLDFTAASRLNTIGGYAFDGCSSLEGELYLPRNIAFLGDAAFLDCSKLSSLQFDTNTDTVPRQSFKNCTSLQVVSIMAGPKEIEAYAFQNCTSLQTVSIPNTVTAINPTAFKGVTDFTIECYFQSYAWQYAVDNGIPYTLLDGVKLGDVNGDEYVSISDVTEVQRHIAELETLDGIYLKAADVNSDGVIDITDATELQKFLAEFDDITYPIGEVITR